MMMKDKYKRFLNIKVSIEYYNELMKEKVFQDNFEAISPAYYFCQRIIKYNALNNGNPSGFYSESIRSIFKRYTHGVYKPYLTALQNLGILNINDSYRHNESDISQSFTKEYQITEKGIELIMNSSKEYLKKLHCDPVEKRKNQKRVSSRIALRKPDYGDYVLSYMEDIIFNLRFDYENAPNIIESINTDNNPYLKKLNQCSQYISLIDFKDRDIHLKYNESDGRLFNDFVALPSGVRHLFQYQQLKRNVVMDIRACHPTFLSKYIFDELYCKSMSNQFSHIPKESIQSEHEKWVKLFTDELIDPRELIAMDIGFEKKYVKQALNELLNGSTKHPETVKWFEDNYPLLFSVWNVSNKKTTGLNISKLYETVLMLDKDLYKATDEMNIKIVYEYDGFSVFSKETGIELNSKVKILADNIKTKSQTLFGFPVVIKVEYV